MRVLVVDDEAPARVRLASLISAIDRDTTIVEAENGKAALAAAEQFPCDCALLDIAMPGMDGFEVARHLATLVNAPAIIFCTAFDDHALRAFEARAIDYLVKPVRQERLEQALARARLLSTTLLGELSRDRHVNAARTHLCARLRGNLQLVPIANVDYMLAEDKYVVAHHVDGEILLEEALKDLEAEFSERFIRVHRNCLVAADQISGTRKQADGRTMVRLKRCDKELEVSRRSLRPLRERIKSI